MLKLMVKPLRDWQCKVIKLQIPVERTHRQLFDEQGWAAYETAQERGQSMPVAGSTGSSGNALSRAANQAQLHNVPKLARRTAIQDSLQTLNLAGRYLSPSSRHTM